MPTRRIARGGSVRFPGRTWRRVALPGVISLGLFLGGPSGSTHADPVSPLVIDEGFRISGGAPWISPTGEQLVTYLRQDAGALPVPGLTSRIGGAPFTPFEALSPMTGIVSPTAGFAPDGTARLVWQAAGTGRLTEQAVRPQGGPVGAATPAGTCDGPTALAVSRTGRTLAACRGDSGTTPRWTGLAGVGQMPSAIEPATELTPAVDELTADPLVAWGTDGTGIVAFGYREGDPPGEWKIAARIVGTDGMLGDTELVDSATGPETIIPTGVAVLPNGTAAITANSDREGVLFTRPPGPGASFQRIDLDQKTASMPSADRWGRLHFLTSTEVAPGETAWWVRVLELDGTVGRAIRVPTTGVGATPVRNGLQVSPNGAEAIVTRSQSGFFRSQRRPGAGAHSVPRKLADSAGAGDGAVALTPQEDLLLVWERQVAVDRHQLMVGGWDGNGRPVIERLSIPRRAKRGVPIRMSVVASDPMGISRIVWRLPGNRTLRGESIRVRLRRAGRNQVEVAVFDRAGNRSLRISQVTVPAPKKRRPQGRAGTSGSPRP